MAEEGAFRGTAMYAWVRDELIRTAQYGAAARYQAVADIMGLTPRRRGVGRILDEISRNEASEGRPMLSAAVANAGGSPGAGFCRLASGIGRAASPDPGPAFWKEEREALLRGAERPRRLTAAYPAPARTTQEAQVTEAADRYEAVRNRLIEVARSRSLTTYGELAPIAGLPAVAVGRLLDEIVTGEVGAGRPMLSAVVVDAERRTGDGFFKLAAALGRAASSERSESFLTAEREAAYRYWGQRERVRDRLIEVARNRGLTTYGELATIAGLPARSVGRLLDEIVTGEVSAERPMLSAVAGDSKGRIGDGFFKMAANLGRTASPERSETFLTAEREAVYEYWSRTAS